MDEIVCLKCKETVTFGENCKCTFSDNNDKKFSLRRLDASNQTNVLNIEAKVEHLSASVVNYSNLCSEFQRIQIKDYDNVKSPKKENKEEVRLSSHLKQIQKLSLLTDEARTIERFQNQYGHPISSSNFIKQDVSSDNFSYKDSTKHLKADFQPNTEFWRSWETKEISAPVSEECEMMSQKKKSFSLFLEAKLPQNYCSTASQENNLVKKYFSAISNFSVKTNVLPVYKQAYNNENEKREGNLKETLKFPQVTQQPIHESKSLLDKVPTSIKFMNDKNNVLDHSECHSDFITSRNMKPIIEKIYECDNSEKSSFNQESLLKIYKSEFENNVIAFENSQKCMPRRDQTERPKRKHTLEKQFVCNICEKRFPFECRLNSHYRMHTNEKLFVCKKCGKGFALKSNLIVHCRVHTGEKPYECNKCKKRFSRKDSLNDHYTTHTNERPFGCDFCKKRFKTRKALVVHHRTHTGEKPYECDRCQRRFNNKSNLNSHYRTHMGEKL